MKIIKLLHLKTVSHDNSEEYLVFEGGKAVGTVIVSGIEIKRIGFIESVDEKYILEKILRILERKASKLNVIKFFIYSDTKHTPYFEKLGFIKRKVFFDSEQHKYFKMFKIV
ncbi:MAG: hypothetical protein JXR69_11205 [Candidatus Delongbacteria bacterium]|nr:hypothetical protein [Candidatus Delongbacteria bacterium]